MPPVRSYGCLNTHCRHSFASSLEPSWDSSHQIAAGPPCELCGARTKWVPGPTQIMRATEGALPKSKFINQTLERAVSSYNARQELAGLKISDVRPQAGEPAIKAPSASPASAQRRVFHDAGGIPWEVNIPVETGNAWPVPVPSQRLKVRQRELAKPFIPDNERRLAGKPRQPQIEASCDRSGRVVKTP